jgi:hypothetical protein
MKLIEYFKENENRSAIHKFLHYFDIYEKYFRFFVNKKVKILEIGVFQGGSLKMWKEYFGKDCEIIGIDIDEKCKIFEEDQIKIYVGSQSDENFLQDVIEKEGPFDIIIDDGGHYMYQQIISFKKLYLSLNNKGIYICEDLHTSYWSKYGGGYKKEGTFIELVKNLIDELNAFNSQDLDLNVTEFTKNTTAIHLYESIVVFEKQNHVKSIAKLIGIVTL